MKLAKIRVLKDDMKKALRTIYVYADSRDDAATVVADAIAEHAARDSGHTYRGKVTLLPIVSADSMMDIAAYIVRNVTCNTAYRDDGPSSGSAVRDEWGMWYAARGIENGFFADIEDLRSIALCAMCTYIKDIESGMCASLMGRIYDMAYKAINAYILKQRNGSSIISNSGTEALNSGYEDYTGRVCVEKHTDAVLDAVTEARMRDIRYVRDVCKSVMTEKQYEAITIYADTGSVRETARILEVYPNAVKTHISAAKKKCVRAVQGDARAMGVISMGAYSNDIITNDGGPAESAVIAAEKAEYDSAMAYAACIGVDISYKKKCSYADKNRRARKLLSAYTCIPTYARIAYDAWIEKQAETERAIARASAEVDDSATRATRAERIAYNACAYAMDSMLEKRYQKYVIQSSIHKSIIAYARAKRVKRILDASSMTDEEKTASVREYTYALAAGHADVIDCNHITPACRMEYVGSGEACRFTFVNNAAYTARDYTKAFMAEHDARQEYISCIDAAGAARLAYEGASGRSLDERHRLSRVWQEAKALEMTAKKRYDRCREKVEDIELYGIFY